MFWREISSTSPNVLCLLLTEFLTRHDRGNLKKKGMSNVCWTLRRRNGAWFDTQLRHVTNIYIFTLVINEEVLDLRAQFRYLIADLHIIPTLNNAFSGHDF
jgi:hypothetical protein